MKPQNKGWAKPGRLYALISLLLSFAAPLSGQQVYDNYEGISQVTYYTIKSARFDSVAVNPAQDGKNPSGYCAKYTRSRQRYDYVKIFPKGRLGEVESYASYDPNAPKLRMKVYSTAPAGTLVEIQLGKKTGPAYPDGTHSQFQAYTTTSGQWEELEFNYSQTPRGSDTGPKEVDQLTILFNPNTNTTHTWYFDDLEGPPVTESHASVKTWRKR